MWEWTIENPGWTSIIVIGLFLCLVHAPALLIAVIPRRRNISKCCAQSCPMSLQNTCRRYTAPSGEHQSWISDESTVGGECPNYLPDTAFVAPIPSTAREEEP